MSDTDQNADATSSTRSKRAPIDSLGLVFPPEWVRFPLGEGDFEQFVTAQRRRLAEETTLSRTAQRQYELLMRQLRNDCQRSDVTLAAVMNAAIEDDGSDPSGTGLLAAACTVSTMSKAALGTELPLTVNTIAAAMAREPTGEDGVEIVNLDAPVIVDLQAGRGVKLVRLHTFPPNPDTLERGAVFVQHFLVPYDDGQRAAVVTFASPTPAYAKPLSGLFDQMMTTFAMFAGDEPTNP